MRGFNLNSNSTYWEKCEHPENIVLPGASDARFAARLKKRYAAERRFRRRGNEARADLAATLGREFDYELLAAVGGVGVEGFPVETEIARTTRLPEISNATWRSSRISARSASSSSRDVPSALAELRERDHEADLVTVPYKWYPGERVLSQAFLWRLLDLTESDGRAIDLVIATKFPSYAVRHPNKVVWLLHQFRQAYELDRTELGQFGESAEDRATRRAVQRLDRLQAPHAAAQQPGFLGVESARGADGRQQLLHPVLDRVHVHAARALVPGLLRRRHDADGDCRQHLIVERGQKRFAGTLQKQAQGYVVPDSFTHGSSAQRIAALQLGLKSGDPATCRTF